jgi:hypothetical protein
MQYQQKAIGSKGSKVLTGTGAHPSLNGYAIIVQEDTVFTAFEVDSSAALSDYGLSGTTCKAGAYITVPEKSSITALTMSSGSCIIYKG